MKNILLFFLLIQFQSYSQVSTITYDSLDIETSSFYDELGSIRVNLFENSIQININLGEEPSILNYQFITKPILSYNYNTENYNILFDIKDRNSPIAGLLDISTNSIMLFFTDGSSLLYIGEGVKIII